MKKIILLLTCLLSIISANSQINIGRKRGLENLYVVEHNDKLFNLLRNTTTYFIVPEDLDFNETKRVIEEIWTFNTIKFISETDYIEDELISTNNAIIKFLDEKYLKVKGNENLVGGIDLYKFQMFFYENVSVSKKGEIKKDKGQVAEILFTPNIYYRFLNKNVDFTGEFEVDYIGHAKLERTGKKEYTVAITDDEKVHRFLKSPESYNFNLGYIKNYFQTLNNMLSQDKSLKIRDVIENKIKIKELKEKTLYAPNWLLKDYNAFTIRVTKVLKPEELFQDYDYKYEILTNEELNTKILNKEEFYYLMHTQYNGEKIISIINSLTGEIIYSIVDNSMKLIEVSDLKKINKLIR